MRHLTPFVFTSLVLSLVLVGCDATGSQDTVILNANSPAPPTVYYEFEYDSDDQVPEQPLVRVKSNTTDNLDDVLLDNGFRRSDVTTARIDSVKLIGLSPKQKKSVITPKFEFDNLLAADLYLGTSTSGVQIARGEFDPNDESGSVLLNIRQSDVTSLIREGSKSAFLQLETSRDIERTDRLEVEVYYEIEVQGV